MADAAHHGASRETEAVGKPGVAAQVSRTVTISLSNAMRYTPPNLAS